MDVEANYVVVKAYQYTTLTSVQVGTGYVSVGFMNEVFVVKKQVSEPEMWQVVRVKN